MKVSEVVQFLQDSGAEFSLNNSRDFEIQAFVVPDELANNSIVWIKKAKNFNSTLFSKHNDVLIVTEEVINGGAGYSVLRCKHSKAVFFSILDKFFARQAAIGIDPTARVLTKNVGKNLTVGFCSFIGQDVILGDDVVIGNNVSIENKVVIGNGVHIFSGTVIGVDGFGFFKDGEDNNQRVPHYGGVIIGDNVEIGANCVVNRGTLGNTVIGACTKIDSLNHIAHNVMVGKNCLITGGVKIGGSAHIGNRCYLAPQCFVKNQVNVGNGCMINSGTIVVDDIEDGIVAHGRRRIKMDYRQLLNI